MRRGTTTYYDFAIQHSVSEIFSAEILFAQENKDDLILSVPLTGDGVLSTDKELRVVLTAEQTLAFSSERKAYAQLRYLTHGGVHVTSRIFLIEVLPTLFDNVMVGGV